MKIKIAKFNFLTETTHKTSFQDYFQDYEYVLDICGKSFTKLKEFARPFTLDYLKLFPNPQQTVKQNFAFCNV